MRLPRKLVLAGALLGVIPIALGIAGLATPNWIKIHQENSNTIVNTTTYGLFGTNPQLTGAQAIPLDTIRALVIAGVAAIAVGTIVAVILDIVTKNPWILLSPQILLIAGPTLILIGLLLYIKIVADSFTCTTGSNPNLRFIMDLDYSTIMILIASLLGFITATYFAFAAGFGHHYYDNRRRSSSTNIVQQSVRF